MLRHCSAVNTRLASEASAKDGLKGILERSEDALLPQFSFHSKPGTPSKGTEDGDKTVQGERGK